MAKIKCLGSCSRRLYEGVVVDHGKGIEAYLRSVSEGDMGNEDAGGNKVPRYCCIN
ncbi:unnamed protein product [Ostreobium quekettii]|uniref:Uncharacterized protein n=1 Tax=Ostreobium quekettii TaxID=121088 RepID=A0A8S1IQS6_9CHLO|nr:unnamed protein product [Ostreobium quekettii]